MENKFVKCECCTHAIEISTDDFDGHGERVIYIALWNYGNYGQRGFWYRLKTAWQLLWKGDIYGDHVILSKENFDEMNNFIQKEFNENQDKK
jgi:hypothetical protein